MFWPQRKTRRRAIKASLIISGLLLGGFALSLHLGGFAAPVDELWPPASDEEQYQVIVFADALHSQIGLWPADDPEGRHPDRLVAWSYGEQQFYMESETGLRGMARATLVPTAGVVRAQRVGWRFRGEGSRPEQSWTFYLSHEGYTRLRAHLEAQCAAAALISSDQDSDWYAAEDSYHALHNCHHWTAHALRQAGLPIWPSHAIFRWSLARQLDRAQRMIAAPPSAKSVGWVE